MSLGAIVRNTVRVAKLAGFREADNRDPIERQKEGGLDGRFQVSATPIAVLFPRHAIVDNVRAADVRVRVGYFRGGGDAGGGDRLSTDVRAVTDMLRLESWLTDPTNYDGVVTGIQTTTLRDFNKAIDGDRTVFWDLNLVVQWEQMQDERAVA